MSFLATASDEELALNLGGLVAEYRQWIDRLEGAVRDGEVVVEQALEGGEGTLRAGAERDRSNSTRIDLIVGDRDAGRASVWRIPRCRCNEHGRIGYAAVP